MKNLALNALVSSEQVRFKQTSETVGTDGRVPNKIRERVPDCGGRQLKRPDGRKCWAGSDVPVLQVVECWRNAGAAECQHRRPERSSQCSIFSGRELAFTFANCRRNSVCRLSSVCLSMTLVRPTQPVEIFGNFFSPYDSSGTLVFWGQNLLVGTPLSP